MAEDISRLTPERAVRLLRAKAAELENFVLDVRSGHMREMDSLRADIALIASLLADEIERADWGNS